QKNNQRTFAFNYSAQSDAIRLEKLKIPCLHSLSLLPGERFFTATFHPRVASRRLPDDGVVEYTPQPQRPHQLPGGDTRGRPLAAYNIERVLSRLPAACPARLNGRALPEPRFGQMICFSAGDFQKDRLAVCECYSASPVARTERDHRERTVVLRCKCP